MFDFKFDEQKSDDNLIKHGIDFVAAQAIWTDTDMLEIAARTQDEPRFLVVGKIGDKHWSVVVTYRASRIRIISVRRSRPKEVALYESERI